ncbi:hypothetical protein HanPI659440_Chr03g0120051 [Helianthus annuus]|nr:hypothetical protein HanPI659440_Chr03g0120051 [Helianthus annuus]
MGRTTENINKGRGRGVDRSSGEQGRSQGSVLGSSDTIGLKSNQQHTLMSSPIEGSDGDDMSSCRIYQSNNVYADYWSKPKGYVIRPWESWKDVPNEDKKRLFERFQWEEKWNGEIYSCWERCIAGKIPDLLCRVRDQAKETARSKDVQVEDDMSDLTDFKPPWIKTETWKQMIEIWNTLEWKAKSKRNKKKIRTDQKGANIPSGHKPM